jgi:predicted flap endonuclease-1-like 5' DNA nuclease
MASSVDPQIIILAAAVVLALLVGFVVGRWSARRRLHGAVADWQHRLTQSEGTRQEADQEVERLAAQLSELNVEVEQARDRAAGDEAGAEDAARRLAEEQQRVAGLSEEIADLKAQGAELREEIETWRDEVGNLQRDQLTAEENLDRLAADLTASRDRTLELEAELEGARQEAATAEQTRTGVEAARTQAEVARTEAEEARVEAVAETAALRQDVARLRQVKADFQQWMQGAAAMEERLDHAGRQLAEATRERDTLRDEIERREHRIAELETELAQRVQATTTPAPPSRPAGERPELLEAPFGVADDLKRIRGIGPVLERTLNQLGVYHFRQIAAWTSAEIEWIASHINTFPARIARDRWAEQAADLEGQARRSGF